MGIDVYMRWLWQTDEEKSAQYTGFSIVVSAISAELRRLCRTRRTEGSRDRKSGHDRRELSA